MTNFDFVVLLVVGEATQQALVGEDYSFTNAAIVIATLIMLDVGLSLVKRASPRADAVLDGRPMVIVERGRPLTDLMRRARVDVQDVLAAARERQGLERLDQIQWAVLECHGTISIVPWPQGERPRA